MSRAMTRRQPTVTWLQIHALRPCPDAIAWGKQRYATRRTVSTATLVLVLLKDNHFPWANWLLVRLMAHGQQVAYAIYAAKQVLAIYEKRYPQDARPRKAIDAAKAYLAHPSEETKDAARVAAVSADAAATAAAATAAAAYAAAYAADAAAAAAAAYAAGESERKWQATRFAKLIGL